MCRVGAGTEKTKGQQDTPGFTYHKNDEIIRDKRGYNKLELSRTNSNRFHQTSFNVLQSWRANCDVKILLYETDPKFPDLREISAVSDYIVAYTCKGHVTAFEEKRYIHSTIQE
jgi:hypothetical protein